MNNLQALVTNGSTDVTSSKQGDRAHGLDSQSALEQPTGLVIESEGHPQVLQRGESIETIVKRVVLELLTGCGVVPGSRVGETGPWQRTGEVSPVVVSHGPDDVNLDGNLVPAQVEVEEDGVGIGVMPPQGASSSSKVPPLVIPGANKGSTLESASEGLPNNSNSLLFEKLVFLENLPEFFGLRKESASNWLAFVKQSINVLHIDDERLKSAIAAGYLKGDASQWYPNYLGGREALLIDIFFVEFSKNRRELRRSQKHSASKFNIFKNGDKVTAKESLLDKTRKIKNLRESVSLTVLSNVQESKEWKHRALMEHSYIVKAKQVESKGAVKKRVRAYMLRSHSGILEVTSTSSMRNCNPMTMDVKILLNTFMVTTLKLAKSSVKTGKTNEDEEIESHQITKDTIEFFIELQRYDESYNMWEQEERLLDVSVIKDYWFSRRKPVRTLAYTGGVLLQKFPLFQK